MVRSIIYGSMNTYYWESCKDTSFGSFFDTFAYCRDVFLRNNATNDLVLEFVALTSSSSSSSASLSGVHISVKNGSGIAGCANEAAAKLTPDGAIVETGNADDFNYSQTLIIYEDSSQSEEAQKIADLLGVGQVKQNDGTYAFSGDFLVVVGSDWS